MTCQWSSMRRASCPRTTSESCSTAVRTVSDRPSQLASPQPTIPLSVSIRTKSQRGATRKGSILLMSVMCCLALGGTGSEAGDDVLLREERNDHDRDGDHRCGRHEPAPVDA